MTGPPEEDNKPRAVIIGGGIAGLATAALLAREGHHVTLLEQGPHLGGRAATIQEDGFSFDTGPSWYLMPGVFEHFFRLLGTSAAEELDLVPLDPAYRVFAEPRPGSGSDVITVPAGRDKVMELFEELEPGSRPALEAYLASAADAEKVAEQFFLYNPFRRLSSLVAPEVVKRLPRLIPLLTVSLERFVARRFRHPVLRQILGYPAVFLGTSPKDAPSMYHLMSKLDLGDGVLYPMGGFTAVVKTLERLALEAGARIITSAEVTSITTCPAGRRARATGVTWQTAEGQRHHEPAETVVSAADLHHTETQLVPPGLSTYPASWWRKRVSGPGAVLVMLGVRGALPQLPHHSLFFAQDWRRNFGSIFGHHPRIPDPASIYVCKSSATDPGMAPGDHENLFILVPVPADERIGGQGASDPQLLATADRAIDQIASWAGIPDLPQRIVLRHQIGPAQFAAQYNSWRGGMLGPAHILSQSAMFRARNESRRIRGLFYAGATTSPGVGVPMCLISAEIVLKRIRGDSSPGPLPDIPISGRQA